MGLAPRPESRGPLGASSYFCGSPYLYAAQTLLLAIELRDPFSARAQELGERATELSILIPNTYDICGSGDARECVRAISEYASRFVAALMEK